MHKHGTGNKLNQLLSFYLFRVCCGNVESINHVSVFHSSTRGNIMYIEERKNIFWVWSSKKASLDCMPQAKLKTLSEVMSLFMKPIRKGK
jgi:hypothetical protein